MRIKETQDVNSVEVRCDEVQEVLGRTPNWILRRGFVLLGVFFLITLVGSYFFKTPDIITTELILLSSNPPAIITAKASGRIVQLNVSDQQLVDQNQTLAIIESSASYDDVCYLETVIDSIKKDIKTNYIIDYNDHYLNLGEIEPAYTSVLRNIDKYTQLRTTSTYPEKIRIINDKIQILNKQLYNINNNLSSNDNSIIYAKNPQSVINHLEFQILQTKEELIEAECIYTDKKSCILSEINTSIRILQTEIRNWRSTYVLTSPIHGRISFNNCWKKNLNVASNDIIFTISPQETCSYLGRILLPIDRSGKVKVGQQVNASLYNYPDNEYEMVIGYIKGMSIFPTDGFFAVDVVFPKEINKNSKECLYLIHGVSYKANIITKETRLFDRIFYPIRVIANR